MKTQKLLMIALIPVLLIHISCVQQEKNEVVINGKFIGDIPERVGFTIPVNQTSYMGFIDIIEIDSTGKFNIIIETDKPAFLSFWFLDSPSLIIEPGKNYNIILERDPEKGLLMNGDLGKLQEFYNMLPHENPMTCMYSFGEDISNYTSIRQNLHDNLEKELSAIMELFDSGEITEEIKDFLVADRKIYYMTAKSVLSSANNLRVRRENEEFLLEEIFSLWSEAANGIKMDNPYIISSFYSWDFLQMYLWYNVYSNYEYDDFIELRAQHRVNATTHAHNIELAKEYLSGDVLEFFLAGTFFYQHSRRQYDNDLNYNFELFKNDFPKSRYLPFVEKTFEEMVERKQELTSNAPALKNSKNVKPQTSLRKTALTAHTRRGVVAHGTEVPALNENYSISL